MFKRDNMARRRWVEALILVALGGGFALPAQVAGAEQEAAEEAAAQDTLEAQDEEAQEALEVGQASTDNKKCKMFNYNTCSKPPWQPCHSGTGHSPWAIYISPKPEDGVPYGGYHVTIAGFSPYQACPSPPYTLSGSIKNAWTSAGKQQMLFRFNSNYVQSIGNIAPFPDPTKGKGPIKGWWVTFKSQDLDTFSKYLVTPNHIDCQSMKGPLCSTAQPPKAHTTPWHVTLCYVTDKIPCDQKRAANVWNIISGANWYFYKVTCQGKTNCVWQGPVK